MAKNIKNTSSKHHVARLHTPLRRTTIQEDFTKFRHEHALLFAAFVFALTALVIINTLYVVSSVAERVATPTSERVTVYPRRSTSLQLAYNGSLQAKVKNVGIHTEQDPLFTLGENQSLLIMDITIQNNTAQTQQFFPSLHLYVRNEHNVVSYLQMSSFITTPLPTKELAPRESVSGQIAFSIPKNSVLPLLYVDTGWNKTLPLVIDVLN